MLVLENADIERALTMRDVLEALRDAYRELGEGEAVNSPRVDLLGVEKGQSEDFPDACLLKTMTGVTRKYTSLRFLSEFLQWREVGGAIAKQRKRPHQYSVTRGSVLLFDRRNANLIAILGEGFIRNVRVGASAALAAEYLSRKDSRVLGVLGSGFMAKAHVEAMALVRKLDLVKVYSPSKDHRENFAAAMSVKTGVKVFAVEAAEEALRDADIVVLATNLLEPVFGPEAIREGTHVTCVRHGEIQEAAYRKFDRLFLNSRENCNIRYSFAGLGGRSSRPKSLVFDYDYGYPPGGMASIEWAKLPDLIELVAGKVPGRQSDKETTCFNNSVGFGVQFAAVGGKAFELAKAKGIGCEEKGLAFMDVIG